MRIPNLFGSEKPRTFTETTVKDTAKKDDVEDAKRRSRGALAKKADVEILADYVKTDRFEAEMASIDSLFSGDSTITELNTQAIRLAGYRLFLGSVTIDGKSYNVIRYSSGGD